MFRHRNSAIAAIAGALSLVVVWSAIALAQDETQEVTIKGEVKDLTPDGIVVEDGGGKFWIVKPPDNVKEIAIGGPAEVGALMPGMLIKFNGVVTKKGVVKDPIKTMSIITQRDEFDVGVYPEGGFGGDADGPGLFGGGDEKKKKKKKPAKPKIEEETECRVGGHIVGLKDGKLAISAGGMSLKAEIAEDAKITVDVTDPSWLRPGDKFEAQGYYFVSRQAPDRPMQAFAVRMTVKAATPYGAGSGKKTTGKKTSAKPTPKTKPKSKPGDDEQAEESDADAKDEKKPSKKKTTAEKPEKKPAKKTDAKKPPVDEMEDEKMDESEADDS